MRHFLKDNDISPSEQELVLKTAEKFAADPKLVSDVLKGETIGLMFEKLSLRTRVSSEVACVNLGAYPIQLRGDELHFSRGESPSDAVKVLSGYLAMLMGRVNSHSLLEELAEPNAIPIVNGLSDLFHPLQALADILTLRQNLGEVKGKTITYLGDANNVSTSLMIAGAMSGINVNIASPEKYSPNDSVVSLSAEIASAQGSTIKIFQDPKEAVAGAQALYTDVWISMGDTSKEEKKKALQPYQINQELLECAEKDAIVLHCLPAHRGEEISAEVMDGRQSKVIEQAHNRLPATMALFLFMLRPEVLDSI